MLTQANYNTWLSAVKDELYAIEADALLAKSALSDTGAEQRGNVADDDVDLSIRRKAFIMLKRSISQDIKSKLEDIYSGPRRGRDAATPRPSYLLQTEPTHG